MDGETLDDARAWRGFEALLARVDATLAQVGDAFPYYADPETGVWETTPDGDWCGGHSAGLLWLAAALAEYLSPSDG